MTNFKAGDKVKMLKTDWAGEVVTVSEVGRRGVWPILVRHSDGRTYPVSAHELELLPAHKFKVGDWVEITGWGGGYEGQIKQIASVPYPGYIYYSFVDKSGGFSDKYLKAAKAPAKFKVGDWVKVHGRNDSYDGTVGTIRKLDWVSDSMGQLYGIDVPGEGRFSFFESQLKAHTPVEYVKGFKVGDRVKIKSTDWDGSFGVIKEVRDQKLWPYLVRKEHTDETCSFYATELEPAPSVYSGGGYVPTVKAKFDNVDGPAHYGGKDTPFEVIKVAEAWGFEKNAYLFNALKYLARAGKKGNRVEDLKKLQYYVAREIALEEAKK